MPQSDPMIGHFGSRRAGASPPRTAARTPRLSEFHQTHTNKFGPGDSTSSPGPSQGRSLFLAWLIHTSEKTLPSWATTAQETKNGSVPPGLLLASDRP